MAFELDPKLDADTHPVIDWALSTVRLMDDQRYPWLILVPRRGGVRDLIDLAPSDRYVLSDEIDMAAKVLRTLFAPYKLNIASLGNIVEQLHVHVIARQIDDDAWPAPVWGKHPPLVYDAVERDELIARLRSAFMAQV
ncbi:MAG: HIT family protein [Rhodospirillales bacterium]